MRHMLSVYDTPTAEEFDGLLSGAVQVRDPFGRPMRHRLTPQQREALDVAKQQHYLVVNAGTSTKALQNSFFMFCAMSAIPYALVERRGQHATVSVDFVSLNHNANRPQTQREPESEGGEVEQFIRSFFTGKQPVRGFNGQLSLGGGYWHVDRVPSERAEELMQGLVRFAEQAVQQGAK